MRDKPEMHDRRITSQPRVWIVAKFKWKMPNAPCINDRAVVRHIATLLVNGFRDQVRICRTETLEVLLTRSVDSEVSE